VLATFKRDDLLQRCLEAVARQDYPRSEYEVVVVDDARGKTAAGVVERVASRYPGLAMRCLPGGGRGPATARNIGWRAARGEVIAFTDDDAYPASEDWLARGVAHFDDASVNAVGGAVVGPADTPPTDFQRNVKALEQGSFLTCNAFYRRRALEAVGGFDERFTAPFREDSDLQLRVDELPGRMVQDAALVVVHPAVPGSFGISLRLQHYSLFNALIYRKHPRRYRAELQARPPLQYYAILLAGLGALGSLALGARPVAGVFGAGWLLLEARFLARRLRGISHTPRHVADMVLTSLLIPPLSVYWRLRGAVRYRVVFF
jgi:glycosyltransferase involved in cell wall biosynthesis